MKNILRGSCMVLLVLAVAACASAPKAPAPKEAAAQGVDLALQAIKVLPEGKLVEGTPVTLEITLKNVGNDLNIDNAAAGLIVPRVMVYQGTTVAGEAVVAASQPIPALKAGAEVTLKLDALTDDPKNPIGKMNLKAGDVTLTVVIDPNDLLKDANKANNQQALQLKVEAKPKEEKKDEKKAEPAKDEKKAEPAKDEKKPEEKK